MLTSRTELLNTRHFPLFLIFFLLLTFLFSLTSCKKKEEMEMDKTINPDVWLDPAFAGSFKDQHVVVWFENQFLNTPGDFSG